MLTWLRRLLTPAPAPEPVRDAVQAAPDAALRAIVAAEIQQALADFKKDQDWVLDEWYEKFSTLHARLAKRARRAEAPSTNGEAHEPERLTRPSILHHPRKNWSI